VPSVREQSATQYGHAVCARTSVAGESGLEIDSLDLFLEEIDLVEEEDEGSVGEPLTVANLIKQQQRF
jgi:hypothetical protein